MAQVTAIVATLADSRRGETLARALESLRSAVDDAGSLRILVVVNGDRVDDDVLRWLQAQTVDLERIAQGSLPLAQLTGRRRVATPYYCFLDDDDEYLPHAIDRRVRVLESNPEAAVVVTNGWRMTSNVDEPAFDHLAAAQGDPLTALFRENWLASCGALFRTEAVGPDYFDDYHQYLEWTWLAYRIATDGRRVAVLDEPTFRIHDTPGSLSKSPRYAEAHRTLYERMLSAATRRDVRRIIQQRIQNWWSIASVTALESGDAAAAWAAYRHVLGYPGAWRYAKQLLRLLPAALRR